MNNRGLFGFIWHPIVKLLIVLAVITFIILFFYTFFRTNTGDPALSAVKDVSLHGLTLSATIPVQNNGVVPVTVENIPYTITLDATNETLASGTVDGFTLGAGEHYDAPLVAQLSWSGSKSALAQGFTEGSANVTIEASVRLRPLGINLLREGLDIPETALVCILDADKEGFLRNDTSLLQTIGRAARNAEGRVIFYADRMTDSMKRAIDVTHARRAAQEKYNTMHGITPATIVKPVREKQVDIKTTKHLPKGDIPNLLIELQAAMDKAAAELDFERAIEMRDRIKSLEKEYGVETPKADD
jgi:hypothetical protein